MKLLIPGRQTGGELGAHESAMTLLKRIHQWTQVHVDDAFGYQSRLTQDSHGYPVLQLSFHPAAEPLSVVAAPEGRVVVSANTASVGPGYHRFICSMLRELGPELGIEWASEEHGHEADLTGYFDSEDAQVLEEKMLRWLGESAAQAIGIRRRAMNQSVALSLRYGHSYPSSAALVTPLGPRDDAWLALVAENPRRGVDVFPWWSPGQGAKTRLGRALNQLWTQVVWRPPQSNSERELLEAVARELESAYRADASLGYPWREWREVLGYLGRAGTLAEEVSSRAAQVDPEEPLVGYRRGKVEVMLPQGFSVTIPGSLSEQTLPDGTWVARDHRRRVSFTVLSPGQADALFKVGGQSLGHRGPRLASRASLGRLASGGGTLTVWCEAGALRALCTIQFDDAEDEAFATSIWHSIDALAQA